MLGKIKKYIKDKYAIYIGWRLLEKWKSMAKKRGYSDINDLIDKGADNMIQRAIKKLFEGYYVKLESGTILDVGAGTGRVAREINKYIPRSVKILCLEIDVSLFHFLKKYIMTQKWPNVTVKLGDYFDYNFRNESFEVVIMPWFIQLSLYKWARVFEVGSKIIKANGYFIFDFIDSQDSLLEKINNPANAPHLLINGKDVEKIANHFGFIKKSEFDIGFNGLTTRYFIYQKQC